MSRRHRTDFPLDDTLVSFWRWRADHYGNLAAYHGRRKSSDHAVRAMDLLVRKRSLAARMDDPERYLAASLALIESAADRGNRSLATRFVGELLTFGEARDVDLSAFYAGLERYLDGVEPAARRSCAARLLRLARRDSATHALACLGIARLHRQQGEPDAALKLLRAPLTWAEEAAELEAEVALRSEIAVCLLEVGRREEAVALLHANVRRLSESGDASSELLETARRNLAAALG